jgi:hypothetical protein
MQPENGSLDRSQRIDFLWEQSEEPRAMLLPRDLRGFRIFSVLSANFFM